MINKIIHICFIFYYYTHYNQCSVISNYSVHKAVQITVLALHDYLPASKVSAIHLQSNNSYMCYMNICCTLTYSMITACRRYILNVILYFAILNTRILVNMHRNDTTNVSHKFLMYCNKITSRMLYR